MGCEIWELGVLGQVVAYLVWRRDRTAAETKPPSVHRGHAKGAKMTRQLRQGTRVVQKATSSSGQHAAAHPVLATIVVPWLAEKPKPLDAASRIPRSTRGQRGLPLNWRCRATAGRFLLAERHLRSLLSRSRRGLFLRERLHCYPTKTGTARSGKMFCLERAISGN